MSLHITVVFCRVNTKREYDQGAMRWRDSYLDNRTDIPHELVVINRCADSPDDLFDFMLKEHNERPRRNPRYMRYDLDGWDCGSWQFAGKNIDTDLLVCFNSSTYITCHLWLKRFVEAVEKYGDGLYGPLTSNEVMPHVRTPCMIFQPHIINSYPVEVTDRQGTYQFESMGFPHTPNFTMWTKLQGYATMLVSLYGAFGMSEWREPANIFRRGNQSACLVKDRHADAYDASDEAGKRKLEELAGLADPVKQAHLDKVLFDTNKLFSKLSN